MDEAELQEWIVYDQINPFGQDRDNWHMAMLATVTARTAGDKKAKVEDFTIKTGPIRRQSLDEMAEIIDSFFSVLGVAPSDG